ncbi:hypothetical protein ABK040_016296 [Willaertia magna]
MFLRSTLIGLTKLNKYILLHNLPLKINKFNNKSFINFYYSFGYHTNLIFKQQQELTQSQYLKEIKFTLNKITETLEDLSDSGELEESGIELEVETHTDGVVNIKISDDNNNEHVFVISRQTPTKELWLSSAISGPWHYKYNLNENDWLSTRETNFKYQKSFYDILEYELSNLLKRNIKLR